MAQSDDQVSIEFMGKTYRVSKDVTLLRALLETGWDSVKGLGCLGGCCGACASFYRLPGETHVRTGLACLIPVQDGISFSLIGRFPVPKPTYDLTKIEDPRQALFDLFPETAGCRNCGSCLAACPQGIDVMRGMWCAVFGDFRAVADLFQSCVQCGLCARVCGAGLRPFLVAVYARRALGAVLSTRPTDLDACILRIESGQYQAEWEATLHGLGEPEQSEGA